MNNDQHSRLLILLIIKYSVKWVVTVRIDREVSDDPVKTKRRMELFEKCVFLMNANRNYANSSNILFVDFIN